MSYEVTSDTVLNAITQLLRSTFTTTDIPNIYKDFIVQNLELPCIVVKQVNLTDYRQMKPHHSLRYMIDIRFHPDKKLQRIEEWGRDAAYTALQELQTDLYIHSQKIHFSSTEISVVDGVTHLLLVFSFFVREEEDEVDDMETLDMTLSVETSD